MRGKIKKILFLLISLFILLTIIKEDSYAAELNDMQAYAGVFDAKYYAKNNPDVVLEFGNNANSLLSHYIQYGIEEGRSASANFNASAYRNRYSDLNAAYGNNMVEYCRHYLQYGKKEGRNAKAESPNTSVATNDTLTLTSVQAKDTNGYSLLGSYSTKYNSKIPRAINVNLAASRINGVIINKGASFSFSNTILPRTVQNGYVEAPVFVNKEISTGIGGGICQVSSTLYACMLKVGLPATERHPHSLPVSYLPEGMDATISGTALDLKFTNIYNKPLMITSSANNGVLTVSLWLKN